MKCTPGGVCPKPKSQISALNSQEEGDEEHAFKMVFVVNMDLAMGVGKVSLLWSLVWECKELAFLFIRPPNIYVRSKKIYQSYPITQILCMNKHRRQCCRASQMLTKVRVLTRLINLSTVLMTCYFHGENVPIPLSFASSPLPHACIRVSPPSRAYGGLH